MAERPDVSDEAPQGYSIRVASRLTGVSSDTLRMWERRYGFPKPERNESQVRVYSDADIERLVLVSRALKAGFRSGEVIHRGTEELRGLLVSPPRADHRVAPRSTPSRRSGGPARRAPTQCCAARPQAILDGCRSAAGGTGR